MLPRICINKALDGFLGRIGLALIVFPVSISSAITEESLLATTKAFLSKPWKLQVLNCKEMIPELSSLVKCRSYNKVDPSKSNSETCGRKL